MKLAISKKYDGAVIVLGAGASKGARLGGRLTPPLDTDFLDVASRMFASKRARGKNRAQVKVWNDFKRHLKSAGLRFDDVRSWRLEQLSTFLEARANLRGLQLNAGRPRDYAQALLHLKVLVGHVLLYSGGAKKCSFHRMLFEAVRPTAVISFNYDLVADQTLLDLGRLHWNKTDYCGSTTANIPTEKGRYYRQLRAGRLKNAVPLLKLHGSINWERMSKKDGYRLSGVRLPGPYHRGFEVVRIPDEPFLIPPVASKIEIKEGALRHHWNAAVDYLHQASSWIIWGYSFPQTDTISQVLFKTALANNRKPKPVLVLNPDMQAAERVHDVCRKVEVEKYGSIEAALFDWGMLQETSTSLPYR